MDLALWAVRGFGTALMHGGSTALLAIVAGWLSARTDRPVLAFAPGLLLAVAAHSAYNHFYLSPGASTLWVLLTLPPIFALVYGASEDATRSWLGTGFDRDQEIYQVIRRGLVSETRIGRYLEDLKRHFPAAVVGDMLCLIRLRVELSIQAKGALLMHNAGFSPPPDPGLDARLEEIRFLERSIGPTGLLALRPILGRRARDAWQRHLLCRR